MSDYYNANGVYIIDSDDDVVNLPTDGVSPGYVAIVADETAHMYMLNNDHQWMPFGGKAVVLSRGGIMRWTAAT